MILSFCLYFIRILGQIHLWGHDMSALFYYEGLLLILSAKRMHKGTSEAPVLSESERERRSKGISLWGEGKRKRFPLQLFAEEIGCIIRRFLYLLFFCQKLHKETHSCPLNSFHSHGYQKP